MSVPDVLIVHHTHWDREWYRTFGDFRYRLLQGVGHIVDLLERDAIPSFLLDGQSVIAEDVRSVLDESTLEKFLRFVASGRIEVGPWFVMPDEFLVRGESLLRNLRRGMKCARDLGANPSVLYLPDTFGHSSQMPQLATSLGLRFAVVGRGVNRRQANLWWAGADGSSIFTHAFPTREGYYNPQLTQDDFVEAAHAYVDEVSESVDCPDSSEPEPILLTAGADHTLPPRDWCRRKELLLESLPFVESRLDEALARLHDFVVEQGGPAAGTLNGELRDHRRAFLLPGIASARVDVKIENQRAEDLLLSELEPLTCWLFSSPVYRRDSGDTDCHLEDDRELHGRLWAPKHIDELWRALMLNHPHDSIGGCSIDAVHEANHARYTLVRTAAARHRDDILRHLTGWIPGSPNMLLHVFNVLPWVQDESIFVAEVDVPEASDKGAISLRRPLTGENVPVQILDRAPTDGFYSEMERAPGWDEGWKYRIAFRAPARGVERSVFQIVPCESDARESDGFEHADSAPIDNDFLEIGFEGNTGLVIHDLNAGRSIRLWLEWHRDDGDSYNSDPLPETLVTGTLDHESSHIYRGTLISWVACVIDGPDGTNVRLNAELRHREPFVRFSVEIDNRSRDTRLSLCLRRDGSHTATTMASRADTPYDFVSRHHVVDEESFLQGFSEIADEQTELAPREHPSLSTVVVDQIQFMHVGVHGYDVEPGPTLRATLLRSYGQLSKGALRVRGTGAGPHLPTPQAQMLSKIEHSFAVGFETTESPLGTTRVYRGPALSFQGGDALLVNGATELESVLFSIDSRAVLMEALYRVDERHCVLRFSNPTDDDVSFHLTSPLVTAIDSATLEDLVDPDASHNALLLGESTEQGRTWRMYIPAKRIAGYILDLGAGI